MLRKWSLGGLGLIFWCLPASAQSDDFLVSVACKDWPAETVSRVEARIRATFLAESLTARQVIINCGPGGSASISVGLAQGELVRPVARKSSRLEDDVVAAVEMALRELAPNSPEPVPEAPGPVPATTPDTPTLAFEPEAAPTSEPRPSVPDPGPAPTSVATDASPPAAGAVLESPRMGKAAEIGFTPLVELWGSHWAFGAEGGLSVGDDLQYGLTLGGAAGVGEPNTFDISEWSGNARLTWTLPGASGLRVALAAGVSLLVTAPAANVVAESDTLLGVASLGLHVSRPFWFGSFGMAPTLGARLFSSRRNVRVDDHEELAIPALAPQAGLWLIYRRE